MSTYKTWFSIIINQIIETTHLNPNILQRTVKITFKNYVVLNLI